MRRLSVLLAFVVCVAVVAGYGYITSDGGPLNEQATAEAQQPSSPNASASVSVPSGLVGLWGMQMAESGAGLHVDLTLNSDGTYDYLRVFVNQSNCSDPSQELQVRGDALSFQGRYRVSGNVIDFVPAVGREGCIGRMHPLTGHLLTDREKSMGNGRVTYRLAADSLCLTLSTQPNYGESCYAKASETTRLKLPS